jgi:pilus assembly protein Flp/PilA
MMRPPIVDEHPVETHPRRDERGATATEYGLLVVLIAVALATAVITFENALSGLFTSFGPLVGAILP